MPHSDATVPGDDSPGPAADPSVDDAGSPPAASDLDRILATSRIDPDGPAMAVYGPDELHVILALFVENNDATVARLDRELADHDDVAVRARLHRIVGSAGMVGANEVVDAARVLHAAVSEDRRDDIPAARDDFAAQLTHTLDGLAEL